MEKVNLKFTNLVWIKIIITVVMGIIILLGTSLSASASAPTSKRINEIKLLPNTNDEEQIRFLIANDPRVIMKWARLASVLGFGWCNGTKSQKIGEDFSVSKAANGDYILQANYNANDPYANGERAEERLKIILSNFQVDINFNNSKWETPITTKADPISVSTYDVENPNEKEIISNKENKYSIAGTVSHTPDIRFGEKIKLSNDWKTNIKFGMNGPNINVGAAAENGWKDSIIQINGDAMTETYKTKIPPHTRMTIERLSQNVKSDIRYAIGAHITYSVTFHGFLRNGGNARIDHPVNEPIVDLTLGNDKKSAEYDLSDLYTHSNADNNNKWIDWSWVKGKNNDYKDIIEERIFNSPEYIKITGKFSYSRDLPSYRDSTIVPLYQLGVVTASGSIPSILTGGSFDLKKISLSGKDIKGFPYYNFNKLPVEWRIISGGQFASVSGYNLIANAAGSGTIAAVVQGVVSSPINFTINNTTTLSTLIINSSIPELLTGSSFNLSQLSIIGRDQFGNNYSLANQSVVWNVISGGNYAAISNNTLLASNAGTGSIQATILGVKSNTINFIVKNSSVLKTLMLTGNSPILSQGQQYDLSRLNLKGIDQFGNNYTINNSQIIWSIASGYNLATINRNILTAKMAGSGTIIATYQGVSSNAVAFIVNIAYYLKSLKLVGTVPGLRVGESYNLSQLSLAGTDQYGNFYNISGQSIRWNTISGNLHVTITGNILRADGEGSGAISATVLGVTSNQIGITIKSYPVLRNVIITGNIPHLFVGSNFNLSLLTLKGTDQYGSAFNISGQPVVYRIVQGSNFAYINGNILIVNAAAYNGQGIVTVTATVLGITSNQINFTVNNQLVLKTLTIASYLPIIYTGSTYDLSQLALAGKDQNNNPISISGQQVIWSAVSGGNLITISNNILRAYGTGTGSLVATVRGVTSNQIYFTIAPPPLTLRTLVVNGTIPELLVGSSYDLSQLTIMGLDQNGNYFNISGQSLFWTVSSGYNLASISGNILRVTGPGSGTITLNILGIASNTVSFTFKEVKVLRTLNLLDTKPKIPVRRPFDLSQLSLSGNDQYGNVFNLVGLPVIWSVTTSRGSGTVTGSILTLNNEDSGSIAATVMGVTSNVINFAATKDPLVLNTLTVTGDIPTLTAGKNYDLSQLNLRGLDQYGDPIIISDIPVFWSVVSNETSMAVSGNMLLTNTEGIGNLTATVKGVTSNSLRVMVVKALPVLKIIAIKGSIPTIFIGKSYNLSKLQLVALDQYGEVFNIKGHKVIWKASAKSKLIYFTGNNMVPLVSGVSEITATVDGVISKPLSFTVKAAQVLKTLTLKSTIPTLAKGKSLDLSKIIFTGKDQYGNTINFSSTQMTWKISSGSKLASITGKILIPKAIGKVTLVSSLRGVYSKPLSFIIKKK